VSTLAELQRRPTRSVKLGALQLVIEQEKRCSRCRATKPLSEFYKNKNRRDGKRCECKECTRLDARVWRSKNLKRARARSRQWSKENRQRANEYLRDWNAKNPERASEHARKAYLKSKRDRRDKNLRHFYGITIAEYEEMARRQDGRCAICSRPPGKKPLAVDHDHRTGEVRALLCSSCNLAIGAFRDSPAAMRNAIAYVSVRGQ
jgi:hypothetical protein